MRVPLSLLAVLALAASSCGKTKAPTSSLNGQGWLPPDPGKTPGHLCSQSDPDFDGYRYRERLPHCRRNVSRAQKVAIGLSYDIHPNDLHHYEIDHFIPLSIGGSNGRRNLWPLIGPLAREKSVFEKKLFDQVTAGELDQQSAILAIRGWQPASWFRPLAR